jgi:hypothetical protein
MPKFIYNWEKALFSDTYTLFSEKRKMGYFEDNFFSKTKIGVFNEEKFHFRAVGLWKQYCEILDSNKSKIGEIKFNSWMSKADISIGDKTYKWQYDNILNSKWKVYNGLGTELFYKSKLNKGEITTNTNDSLLILCGLYVQNYLLQYSIVLFVIFFFIIL